MARQKASPDGTIRKRVFIQASPSTIYEALTDARALVRWFCDRASSDPRVGGELTAYWRTGKPGVRGRAVFRRLEPDAHVELHWVDEGGGPAATAARHLLSYKIVQKKSVCEVSVTDHDTNPLDEETCATLNEGWNSVLMELKDYCEREERSRKSQNRRLA